MKNNEPTFTAFARSRACRPRLAAPLVLATLFLAAVLPSARSQSYSLTNTWALAGTVDNLDTSADNRGMTYGLTNQVLVNNKGTHVITLYDGNVGTSNGAVNITGVSGGTFTLNKLGFGTDGVLYGANLNTAISSSSAYKLYQWTNWTQAPTNCYSSTNSGDAAGTILNGKRLGDTFAITGGGANTWILAGVGGTNAFVLMYPTNGIFTSTVLEVASGLPAPGSGVQFGLAFYTNNTFMVEANPNSGNNLYLIQFPANFASLTSPVAATVIATNTGVAGEWLDLSYNATAGLLATHANTFPAITLYSLPATNFAAVTTLATTNLSFTTSTSINGNETGDVALGGAGNTNAIYTLDTSAGLQATTIGFTAAGSPPSITGPAAVPAGAYPPQTLTVSALGTTPLHYQWYVITATSTNAIAGATTNFYTITTPVTNSYEVVVTNVISPATSAVVAISLSTPVTNSAVSNLWSIPVGSANYSFLADDNNARGIAYDTNTSRVVVASMTSGAGLYILDGNTGTNIGTLNTSGMFASSTFTVDQVGIADDGVVYVGNLAISGQSFSLSSFPAATNGATFYQAWGAGDPGNGSGERWGDNMAVRGRGANTQILLTSRGGTNVVLFTTTDGINFQNNVIPVTGVPTSFGANGVAFGAGNTFWAKSNPNTTAGSGDLYEISFDPVGLTASVVIDYSVNGGQIVRNMSGVGIDPVNNIMSAIDLNDQNNDVQLFELTGDPTQPPVLFDQAFFPSFNPNLNYNTAIAMKYPRVYAIDVNNGIVALQYGTPSVTKPTISQQPAGGTIYAANFTYVLSGGASGSLPIYYQWQFNTVSNLATAANINGATNASYDLTNPTPAASGWYDVIAKNVAGSATSSPVQLTVVSPVTSGVVTQIWRLAAGSRPYLDSFSYDTRGLAYDTNTGTLLVSDYNTTNIYILDATNGSDIGTLNTAGLPQGGYVGFVLNLVGVGDDGVVYGANLANTVNGDNYSITGWPAIAPGQAPTFNAYGPGDPGSGSGDRWGDTLAVRGAGVNTEILIGSYTGTNVVLFTTTDGQNFTPNLLAVNNVPAGFASLGIAFGAGNTFWTKGGHFFDLRQIAFDPVALTTSVLENYNSPTPIPEDLPGIGVDAANNILAGICTDDTPNDMQLYELSGNTNAPALFDQAFFASSYANANGNAQCALRAGWAFGLDVNNGIVAMNYGVPSLLPFPVLTVAYQTGVGATLTWTSFNGHSYQPQYKNALTNATWTSLGSPTVATNATMSYLDTSATGADRFYRVVGK